MSSSISSSDTGARAGADAAAWRRFLRLSAAIAAGLGLAVWLAVVTIDPWDMLPLSPALPRVPISTNARFSMPALAVSPRFDSAIIGTSTSRLLRPDLLDRLLGARFANLSMNSATPWEQGRMIALFVRHHPAPAALVVGLDSAWCLARADAPHSSGRPFPAWMYEGSPWLGYLHMADLYALQEAANQLMVVSGARRQRYGSDGYTDFLPPDDRYDRRRVEAIFRSWGLPSAEPAASAPADAPALSILDHALRTLPDTTSKILYLPPVSPAQLGVEGSWIAASWQACRDRAAAIARAVPNTTLVDFTGPGPVTRDRGNFWDPVHYRVAVADRVMHDLADAVHGAPAADGFGRVLVSPSGRTP